MTKEKKCVIIIDSNSIIHRAYHALPPLSTKKGELVNAVYGFLLVFLKAIKDFQPDFVITCFDSPTPTFRHKQYKEYKAQRPPTPKELYEQVPKLKEILKSFNVPILEKEGFEADDIIGSLALQATQFSIFNSQFSKLEIIIISGDLDTLQLVDSNTRVYLLRKGMKDIVLYDEKLVKEKYGGLTSQQLPDFKALRGDPSDNIPGVKGIGEKTAIKLLLEFGALENLYKEIEKNSEKVKSLRPQLKELLLKSKEKVFLFRDLIQIKKDIPIDFDLEKYPWGKYDKEKVIKMLKEWEFYSLIERLKEEQRKTEDSSKLLKLW